MAGWLAALWLVPGAHAESVLVVEVDRPVLVVVNMKPYTPDGSSIELTLPDGREGTQNVRIRNLLGEQQWMGTVDVPADSRVTMSWRDRSMSVGEPVPIAKEPPRGTDQGSEPEDDRVVKAQREPLSERALGPEPAAALPASTADRAPEEDPFLAAVAAAGASEGPDDVGSGADEDAPDGSAAAAGEDAAPLAPGTGAVVLTNRTTSWTNVYVDGELHEFRGDQRVEVPVAPGVHELSFRDFRDRETWWSGRLEVAEGERVELQFSRAAPPVSLDHPDAWSETP